MTSDADRLIVAERVIQAARAVPQDIALRSGLSHWYCKACGFPLAERASLVEGGGCRHPNCYIGALNIALLMYEKTKRE